MSVRRVIELFNSSEDYRKFRDSLQVDVPCQTDSRLLGERALALAEQHEPKGDRNELKWALEDFGVSCNPDLFHEVRSLLQFLTYSFFDEISKPISASMIHRIAHFDGPKFFFVGHTSYFDYVFADRICRQLGLVPPIMHVTGSLSRGWISQWLNAFRSLILTKSFSPVQHRAYAWYCAALAELGETQSLFSRTSRLLCPFTGWDSARAVCPAWDTYRSQGYGKGACNTGGCQLLFRARGLFPGLSKPLPCAVDVSPRMEKPSTHSRGGRIFGKALAYLSQGIRRSER